MREVQLLDRELSKYKTVYLYRKDISLFQRSLKVEATSVLQEAEAEAKRHKLGEATLLVIIHDAPPNKGLGRI